MTDDLFIREDISKPENRVNLALFSVMQQDQIREWFLERLGLSADAVVYPPKDHSGVRPDLKVVRGSSTEAWIEVELSKDESQIRRYREALSEPVRRVWGRKTDGGDLSLEELDDYLVEQTNCPPQVKVNVEHLHELIQDGLGTFSSSQRRAEVSDEMWNHELVAGLRRRLGDRLVRTTGSIRSGFIGADTTDTANNQGISLRVRSEISSTKTVSLMHITAGRPEVGFPSLPMLRKYLPDHHAEVGNYASVLAEMGLLIDRFEERQRPSCSLNAVLGRLDKIGQCLSALADAPSGRDAIVYQQRDIGDWSAPTVSLLPPARDPLHLQVRGEIINEAGNTAKLREWKSCLTSEVKGQRGYGAWDPGHEYAISLALRFYPGYHGGGRLDVENFVKPVIDAIAAGLFCSAHKDPSSIDKWDFDDSNFNTLLIHRLPDADGPREEGVAIFVTAR